MTTARSNCKLILCLTSLEPKVSYPGLKGDLEDDPIGLAMKDRLEMSGCFTTPINEVEAKKKGAKIPKSIKLLPKGKEEVKLIEDTPAKPVKDTTNTKPA